MVSATGDPLLDVCRPHVRQVPGKQRKALMRNRWSWLTRLQALVLMGVFSASALPTPIQAKQSAGAGQTSPVVSGGARNTAAGMLTRTGAITGSAWNADNSPIPHARLQLRNVNTGTLVARTTADESGQFTFTDIPGGTYVIELVSDAGKVVTIGEPLTISPGESLATFVRTGTKLPWFNGFFSNAALAVAAAAAATGLTALAPEVVRPVSGRQ